MAKHIMKCPVCHTYTMKSVCTCGEKTIPPKPPKYSPEDKYSDYRRKVKEEKFIQEGLI